MYIKGAIRQLKGKVVECPHTINIFVKVEIKSQKVFATFYSGVSN